MFVAVRENVRMLVRVVGWILVIGYSIHILVNVGRYYAGDPNPSPATNRYEQLAQNNRQRPLSTRLAMDVGLIVVGAILIRVTRKRLPTGGKQEPLISSSRDIEFSRPRGSYEDSDSKFCSNCGSATPLQNNFCTKCGTTIH